MLFWLTCTPSIDLIREDRAWFAHTESLKSKYADARAVDLEGWQTVWFKGFFSLSTIPLHPRSFSGHYKSSIYI